MTACKLVHAAVQMLLTHFLVGAHVSPLEHRPEGLYAIGVGLSQRLSGGVVLTRRPRCLFSASKVWGGGNGKPLCRA